MPCVRLARCFACFRWVLGFSSVATFVLAAQAPNSASSAREPGSPVVDEAFLNEHFGSERARAFARNFPARGALTDLSAPPRSPEESRASFKLLPGLAADVVLHEPQITQPVYMNFDERGRLWVVQFIQYPYPAGLKIVDLGGQFHAKYDKVPAAPPNHVRGADKITIHEDKDGDGTFETHKVFVDGLNMVTSVERGRGGVWVLNPPYLLFYPDANNDDVPDGDPIVHLAGFNLEDTHSIANSLQWGVDGWLWGVQGSGVTAKVRRPGLDSHDGGLAFQGQAVWRYHPETRAFELFAEGGGNPFSLSFDAKGAAFGGTNNGGIRGYHYEQGSYYRKSWGEHGYLTNPYAFGYFEGMAHTGQTARFTQTQLVYEEGGRLGRQFEGNIIAPNALQHCIYLTERIPVGSTYRTRDAAMVLESDDRWFRPVDIKAGPDGAIYVADWYDSRLAHMDIRDTWDRKHGRIYRIRNASAARGLQPLDLGKKTSAELVAELSHPQLWHRRTALRLLADRRDMTIAAELTKRARQSDNPHALDALLGLNAVGALSGELALELIQHSQTMVRAWTVRLVTDRRHAISRAFKEALAAMARGEPDAQARCQLAASARRLPGDVALPIILALMARTEDADDPHLPLMIWWALERFATSNRADIVAAFADSQRWQAPLAKKVVLPRLAQRYFSEPTLENQQAIAQLAKLAPPGGTALLREGIAQAFEGREIGPLAAEIESALFSPAESSGGPDPQELSLLVKRGDAKAIAAAHGFIRREDPGLEDGRVAVIRALADARIKSALPVLMAILSNSRSKAVREASLTAIGRFDDVKIVPQLLAALRHLDEEMRLRAMFLLVSRPAWAADFIRQVGHKEIVSKSEIPDEVVRRARLLGDSKVSQLADQYFGKLKSVDSADKQRQLQRVAQLLASGRAGDALAGKAIYEARCATCHLLHGRGGQVGPDLTGYERTNLADTLLNIVDPSANIREGYASYLIRTTDGRSLVGFMEERGSTRVVLRDPAGQRTTIAQSDIVEESVVPSSVMPEGLLDSLTDRELRDFFAYFTSQKDPAATSAAHP